MIRLSGLWLKEKENGDKYFSGSMGGVSFKVFKNSYKEQDNNEPDYILYVDESKPKRENVVPKTSGDDVPF